jgi:hypothetical protein
MVAAVREKLREVEGLAIDEGKMVRSFGKEESMEIFLEREESTSFMVRREFRVR